AALRFDKYEGLGNDFLLIEHEREGVVAPARARSLCDRRRGVGGDGVLLVLPPVSRGAMARMVVLNADGSRPEMCGNGIRCVAIHLAQQHPQRELVIDTDAGVRTCMIENEAVTVDMGEVRVTGKIDLDLDGTRWHFTTATAGNPHAIATRDIDVVDPASIETI